MDARRVAHLATLRVLRLLFDDAAESVPMDPPEYLADMYCLWRTMAIAMLPVVADEELAEQEEFVRQQVAEVEERLLGMMRAYGYEAAMLDTEHAELLPRTSGRRLLQR